MKFIFFGTPEFAAIILEKLIKAGFIPQAVVCNPDKPVGRKQIITPPPVKIVTKDEKLETRIIQPEKLDSSFISHLSSLDPDLFIVAAYSRILSKEILKIPRLGSIGVHPSLLPKYRGATPIQNAILNGDEKTGVSLFLIDEKMDHGPILAKSEIRISEFEIYESLHDKLAKLGAKLLIQYLESSISQGLRNIKEVGFPEIEAKPQDESQATYTKKFSTQDAFIKPVDLEKAQKNGGRIALEIERKIRALNPEPGVWTIQQIQGKQKRVKLLGAKIIDENLKIIKIQVEGGKPQLI